MGRALASSATAELGGGCRGSHRQGCVFKDELGVSQAAHEKGQLIQAEGIDCAKTERKHAPSQIPGKARTMAPKGPGAPRGTGHPTPLPFDSHDFLSAGHMRAGKTSGHKSLC